MQFRAAVKELQKQHGVKKLFSYGDCSFVYIHELVTKDVTKKLKALGPIVSELRERQNKVENDSATISSDRLTIELQKSEALKTKNKAIAFAESSYNKTIAELQEEEASLISKADELREYKKGDLRTIEVKHEGALEEYEFAQGQRDVVHDLAKGTMKIFLLVEDPFLVAQEAYRFESRDDLDFFCSGLIGKAKGVKPVIGHIKVMIADGMLETNKFQQLKNEANPLGYSKKTFLDRWSGIAKPDDLDLRNKTYEQLKSILGDLCGLKKELSPQHKNLMRPLGPVEYDDKSIVSSAVKKRNLEASLDELTNDELDDLVKKAKETKKRRTSLSGEHASA